MLKTPARTYAASMDYLRLEKALGARDDFWIIGSGGDGEAVMRELYALEPDLLVLEGNLMGLDGLRLLEVLGHTMAAPPRVTYLSRAGEAWARLAMNKGADAAAWNEEGRENALQAALDAMNRTPRLAQPWKAEREGIAERLLKELEIPDFLKGRAYMRSACAALACAPQLSQPYSRRLYPLIADRYHTTAPAVERAVRTAVEYTWLHGNLDAIGRLFGLSVDADRGKPTNAEFLSMLAEHVKRETARRMQIAE